MFDIGWSELLVIGVVAIIVVGPKDLPKLMRGIGHYAGKLRRSAADFQRQFEEAMRESEVPELRKAIESVQTEQPVDLKAPIDRPIMLPKPDAKAGSSPAKPKQARKRGPAKPKGEKPKSEAKPKAARAKRGKKPAEPV
jgi:sec-independent protein translocase protein TatB